MYYPKFEGQIVETNPLPKDYNFEELYKWLNPIYQSEINLYRKK